MAVNHDIGTGEKCIFDTSKQTNEVGCRQHKVCTNKVAADEPAKIVFLMV